MENASKALIIAGAILISILIISFGVIILGQGGDVIKNANMSDAEVTAFNGKFDTYEGSTVRGSNVKQLIKTVSNHDFTETDDSKKVKIIYADPSGVAESQTDSAIDSVTANVLINNNGTEGNYTDNGKKGTAVIGSGSVYTVKCVKSSNGGLIRMIYVHKNNT